MMELSSLSERLSKRLLQTLPGAIAHEPMRAVPVGDVTPNFQHKLPPKPGAVLILLYEEDGHIRFPLIVRPDYPGAHGGQISLPGGKAEQGEDSIATALREGEEEIGIDRTKVEVIGKLTDFFVIPSNFLVTPVVGIVHDPVFHADAREVSRIISCDLFDLLLDGAIKTKEITAAGKYRMMAPHFEIEGEVVWGATAMMLNEFRTVLLEH